MPLRSIAFATPNRASDPDAEITPAELPSGRVRFSDELGRETALAARRDGRASGREAGESNGAKRTASRAKPEGDDDEVALALAALGLAPPPPAPELPKPTLDGGDALAEPLLVSSVAGANAKTEVAGLAGATLALAGAATARAIAPAATNPADASLVGELMRAATAKSERIDPDATLETTAPNPATNSNALQAFHALLASSAVASDAAKAPHAAADAKAPAAAPMPDAERAPPADALPRVALADVPHALPALLEALEPDVRFGRRGKSWEVELRLDPPELGSLRFRLELHGDEVRGVVQCEPRVERLLGPVLKDLEENLRRQGGGASFDLHREAREEERPSAPRASSRGAIPGVAAEPRAPSRVAADPSRLVDVTA